MLGVPTCWDIDACIAIAQSCPSPHCSRWACPITAVTPQALLLEDLKTARQELETANSKNARMWKKIQELRAATKEARAGLEEYKDKTHQTEAAVEQARLDLAQLKVDLG